MHWKLLCGATAIGAASLLAQTAPQPSSAPEVWTWDTVKDRFELNNITLQASRLNIDELKAQEITANLRPNPDFTLSADGTQIAPSHGVWTPFAGTFVSPGISYLFERRNKRGLRYDAAKQVPPSASRSSPTPNAICCSTCAAPSSARYRPKPCSSSPRTISSPTTTSSRSAATATRPATSHTSISTGLELQRVQYESDLQTADVNLRTAKINLLTLLNDRRPVESFDVVGLFDFSEDLALARRLPQTALDTRPDLKAAMQSVELAQTNYKLAEANGSTDPDLQLRCTHKVLNNPDALLQSAPA